MKFLAAAFALPCLFAGALGLVAGRTRAGYVQGPPPTWTVEVTPGGPHVELNGTVQQVRSELLKLNPRWDSEYLEGSGKLSKRAVFDAEAIHYGGIWRPAWTYYIADGINYLRRVAGKPKLAPGFGTCSRVSCSNNAAIWWCNDAPTNTELSSFSEIADGAQAIREKCDQKNAYFGGQAFHKDNWNVIVRLDRDNC